MLAPQERTRIQGPPAVDWWIVSKCNLACDYCYGPIPARDPVQLRPSIAKRIAESSTLAVTFCGGEPLTVPGGELIGYARLLQESGKKVILNTNGLLVASRLAPQIQAGEKLPFDIIGISIDGASEEAEKNMRGAKASLKLAVDAALWAKEQGIELKIATVVSSVNVQQMPEMTELVSKLKPKKWRLYQYSPRNNGGERHMIGRDVFNRAVERVKSEIDGEVEIHAADNEINAGCFIVRMDGKVVWPDGTIYKDFEGNDCLAEPIDVIWNRYPGTEKVIENKKWHGSFLVVGKTNIGVNANSI